MTPEEERERFASAPRAILGTIDPDGRPNLVPFVFVLEGDTIYTTVDAKPKRTTKLQRLRNLERDPRVTVIADHYDDEWGALWWVRIRGTAHVTTDDTERERAFAGLRAKYPQYAETDVGEIVIAIQIEEWSSWSWMASRD